MARTYATSAELAAYTGQAAPDGAALLLTRASQMLDAQVFRMCWYVVDSDGMPTDPLVLAAFRDATCAQVQWWDDLGDSIGAAGAGWGGVKIGSVQLDRSVTAVSGADSPSRQLAPQVGDALASPDLTPDKFRIGAVTVW